MPTFRLRRFSNTHTLKAIHRESLIKLLQPHAVYFCNRGLDVNSFDGSAFSYEKLVSILMTPDEKVPQALGDDLHYVHELATDDGMDYLLNAIEALPAETQGAFCFDEQPTPADVAVQVRLVAPALLERAHAEKTLLTAKRSFETYLAREESDFEFCMPSAAALASLEDALGRRFGELKRGTVAKVFIFERGSDVHILIRHGQPCKREGAISDSGPDSVFYRPEIYDILCYKPHLGELSMNAETKKIGALYREKLGLYLFGDSEFFPGTQKYTLQPLIDDGAQALVCSDVDGIESIKLKEIQIDRGGPEKEIETRRATDIFAALERRQRKLSGRLIKVTFSVQFSDGMAARSVTIRPPNIASYTRDGDEDLIEQWLSRRGFCMNDGAENDILEDIVETA